MTEEASDPRVSVTRDGGIARVTLNNPRRKNAITLEMGREIESFCYPAEELLPAAIERAGSEAPGTGNAEPGLRRTRA